MNSKYECVTKRFHGSSGTLATKRKFKEQHETVTLAPPSLISALKCSNSFSSFCYNTICVYDLQCRFVSIIIASLLKYAVFPEILCKELVTDFERQSALISTSNWPLFSLRCSIIDLKKGILERYPILRNFANRSPVSVKL